VLNKADAEAMLAAIDDVTALEAALIAAITTLLEVPKTTTDYWDDVVAAAGGVASWPAARVVALQNRQLMALQDLAIDLAELRRLSKGPR
jgi:hypothetical protein